MNKTASRRPSTLVSLLYLAIVIALAWSPNAVGKIGASAGGQVDAERPDGPSPVRQYDNLSPGEGKGTAAVTRPSRDGLPAATVKTSAIPGGRGENSAAIPALPRANSNTAISSSPNPSTFGQPVTFTATVTSTAGTPSGTIVLNERDVVSHTVPLSNGVAAVVTSTLGVGVHELVAEYGGDADFAGSTSLTLTQTVNKAGTSTSLRSLLDHVTFGQYVTFRVTVSSPAGTPTGTVAFKDWSMDLGTAELFGGTALFTPWLFWAGYHRITAEYLGSGSFLTSTTTLLLLVDYADTTVTVDSSPNPSVVGQPVAFTATVSSPYRTPDGTVTLKRAGTPLMTTTLSGGVASFVTSTLSGGTHAITADYDGDINDNFNLSSGSVTQVVDRADTIATVTSSLPNPSLVWQPVTVGFSLTSGPPGIGEPTGMVTVTDGVDSCSAALPAFGCDIIFTSAGAKNLAATYGGDNDFRGSTSSNPVIQEVRNPTPIVTGISPRSTSVNRGAFTLTITGANFVRESKVRWSGADRVTTFISSTQLIAAILTEDTASEGAARVTVYNPAPNGGASGEATFTVNRFKVFLPLLLGSYVIAPDLVVQSIEATANGVMLVVRNQGNAPVVDDFWVDVYINPSEAPTGVNQTWNYLSNEGLVWGVTAPALPLMPGEVLTLTIGDDYYWPTHSEFSGSLLPDTPVYAQVDSANANTTYGAIWESDETVGGVYNNVGSGLSTAGSSNDGVLAEKSQTSRTSIEGRLPGRP